MAGIVDRPYQGERDLERATDLLLASRIAVGKNRAPTAKRLALLATSRLWEPGQDAHIWEAERTGGASDGELAGFALLWRREESSLHLDLELITNHTGSRTSVSASDMSGDLLRDMLDWALRRAATLATKMRAPVRLSVATFTDQQQLQALLRRSSFVLQDSHNLYMTCALDEGAFSFGAPDELTVRPLRDEREIGRYASLYSFMPMSAAHRLELLRSPDYIHLVAVAPDGDFIAFCECSIDREEWARGGRQTGWVEYVGVRQNAQGHGLGRAIVSEGLRWLRFQGARTAALVTMGTNSVAQRMYRAIGFTVSERDFIYVREIDSPLSDTGG